VDVVDPRGSSFLRGVDPPHWHAGLAGVGTSLAVEAASSQSPSKIAISLRSLMARQRIGDALNARFCSAGDASRQGKAVASLSPSRDELIVLGCEVTRRIGFP